jgi:hypothetical protein
MLKKYYLVGYDYGMGGAWALINARSKDDIMRKYPELIIPDTRPSWVTEERLTKLLSADIDDPPSGWLAELVKARAK